MSTEPTTTTPTTMKPTAPTAPQAATKHASSGGGFLSEVEGFVAGIFSGSGSTTPTAAVSPLDSIVDGIADELAGPFLATFPLIPLAEFNILVNNVVDLLFTKLSATTAPKASPAALASTPPAPASATVQAAPPITSSTTGATA